MLNKVSLMGRLVADPELKTTGSGVAVASFRIASDRDYKSGGGERETDFVPIVAWRGTAEFVSKYFSKGRMVVIDGRLQTSNYTDKDGNKRTKIEVVADHVYFGDSKPGGGGSDSGYSAPDPNYSAPSNGGFNDISDKDDGELPF